MTVVSFWLDHGPNEVFAPSVVPGLIGQRVPFRQPDGSSRPCEVIDAEVVEGECRVTVRIEPIE